MGEQVRIASEPVAYTYGPQHDALVGGDADIANRAVIAKRRGGGHPLPAWSTGEKLAVALVLHDHPPLAAVGFTWPEALQRVASGRAKRPSERDRNHEHDLWLDRVRTVVNDCFPRALTRDQH